MAKGSGLPEFLRPRPIFIASPMDGCWGHAKWAPHFVGGRPSNFLEIADLFGLVFAKSGSLILVHALT